MTSLSVSGKQRAFSSYAIKTPEELPQDEYHDVLNSLARNAKMGPFLATSGMSLPCEFPLSPNSPKRLPQCFNQLSGQKSGQEDSEAFYFLP